MSGKRLSELPASRRQAFHAPANRPRPRSRLGLGCLGKTALKTHALQTLRDHRASPNRAKRLECVRFIGAFHPARDGPRFMVAMHAKNESNIRWGIASRLVRCSELDVRCSMLDVFLPFGSGR